MKAHYSCQHISYLMKRSANLSILICFHAWIWIHVQYILALEFGNHWCKNQVAFPSRCLLDVVSVQRVVNDWLVPQRKHLSGWSVGVIRPEVSQPTGMTIKESNRKAGGTAMKRRLLQPNLTHTLFVFAPAPWRPQWRGHDVIG